MTLLSDGTLISRMQKPERWEPWQRLVVEPFAIGQLQPCSIDVHLGSELRIYTGVVTDTHTDNARWWKLLPPLDGAWVLSPGKFYLATLQQRIVVPEDCCGQLSGISTRARDGVTIHQQAGLLDPGYDGYATLEITVETPHTVLYAGQRIGQVTFTLLDHRCDRPYAGRYQYDSVPQPARLETVEVASWT